MKTWMTQDHQCEVFILKPFVLNSYRKFCQENFVSWLCILGSRKTDIIFAVDTSSNFLRQSNVLPEIKKFITQFVQSFKGGANTRYSLISYYKYVDVFLTLNEYLDSSDLLSLIDLLDEGTSSKDTSEALSEARMMFEGESTNGQKKVLIILTNGFSQGKVSIFSEILTTY